MNLRLEKLQQPRNFISFLISPFQLSVFCFQVEGLCPRCHMVCIDQQTGEKTVEPLRTISEQFGGKIRFGIYMTYVGTIDGSKDCFLKNYASMKPFTAVEDISR